METLSICKKLFPDAQVICSMDRGGRGKGWAIRKGVLASCHDIIVFLDADMDIHPRMIKRLLPFLEDYDIVVGCKGISGLPLSRKLITLASRIYIKLLFWLDVDTQSGIKAMHKHAITLWKTNGFAFDMEFLATAKKKGLKMAEVNIIAQVSKKKSLGVLCDTLGESLRIWYRLSFRKEEMKK